MNNNILSLAQTFSDRDLIESVVNSYFILDYGVISAVNGDKTVNVTHAKIQELSDGTKLPALKTKNLEVLTLSCAGFSVLPDIKQGDKVLLLGLKDYVPKVEEVSGASNQTAYMHYKRDGMKVLPLCVFNADAKIKIECSDGNMKVTAKKIELNGNDKQFVTWAELNSALQGFITDFNSHVHPTPNGPSSAPTVPLTLDISSSKTSTIVTGG